MCHSFSSKEQASFNIMAAVIVSIDFGARENKVCHCFPICLPWSVGTRCHDLTFLNVVSSQLFHSPLLPSSRGSSVPLHFLPKGWCHLHIWGYWCFSQQFRDWIREDVFGRQADHFDTLSADWYLLLFFTNKYLLQHFFFSRIGHFHLH